MDIPVQLGPLVEIWIDIGEETSRDPGRTISVDEMIECEGYEYLVDVQRKGCKVEETGDWVEEGGQDREVGEERVKLSCSKKFEER